MEERICWFVAYVHPLHEQKVAGMLAEHGVEAYVPVRKVKRQWSDRVKTVNELILPKVVFVRCGENVRRQTFRLAGGITGYMMDRTSQLRRVLTVPDSQMQLFMQVVASLDSHAEVEVTTAHFEKGDMVRMETGPLKGIVSECVEVQNRKRLLIRLGLVGALLVSIDASDAVKLSPEEFS